MIFKNRNNTYNSVNCISSSLKNKINIRNNYWFRIADKLLSKAGITINGSAPFDIQVKHPDFFKRVLQNGSIGMGESYMDVWWECERLDLFFTKILLAGIENQLPFHFKENLRILIARFFNLQNKKRAWIVGKKHYDLGNDIFSRILDPFMQYSCAYWKEASTLEEAQLAKLNLICKKLNLKPGMNVLDIGCGWGGLAYYMAKNYRVNVVGITISSEQYKIAKERCAELNVQILLQDYRDLYDKFDRIVSVGMFEHVGPKNYRTYFKVVDRNLKPDGIFLLHTIGSKKTDYKFDPWINKYIFPNSYLPSAYQIAKSSEPHFIMEDWHNFGTDYDTTLMAWYTRFLKVWPEIADKYSDRFKRMFSYYLNVCAGAFRARNIHLWQIVFSRGIENGIRIAR